MTVLTDFYVYIYLNPLKPGIFSYLEYTFQFAPFYVGKGHGNRAYSHLDENNQSRDTNRLKVHTLQKIKRKGHIPEIVFIPVDSENDAFILERALITTIGRVNLKTGILTNLTQGGEGTKGLQWNAQSRENIRGANNPFYGKKLSADHVAKMHSLRNIKGKSYEEIFGQEKAQRIKQVQSACKQGDANPNKVNKGKTLEEICGKEKALHIKQRVSESRKGKPLSTEHRKKLGKSGSKNFFFGKSFKGQLNGHAKPIKFISPEGMEHVIIGQFEPFCISNSIDINKARLVRKGILPDYKGWKILNHSLS